MPVLSRQSKARLQGVHPALVRVVERAITLTSQDFLVLEGVRTLARQHALYAQGRTTAMCRAAGVEPHLARPLEKQVTWTLKSRHFAQADGYGHAVDLAPYPVDWNDTGKFDAIAHAMFAAAQLEGVTLRWGRDWNQNGRPGEKGEADSPHFEVATL